MRCFRSVAALIVFLLCSASSVLAHEWSWLLYDREGQQQANVLLKALDQAKGDVGNPTFLALFLKDPNLSKRAYVAMLDHSMDMAKPADAKASLEGFARLISEKFSDPFPTEVLAETRSMGEIIAYLDLLRVPLSADHYYANRSHYTAAQLAAIRPLRLKEMRVLYARGLSDFELMISELDGLEPAVEEFDRLAPSVGLPSTSQSGKADLRNFLDFAKLGVLADLGLLAQFQESGRSLWGKEVSAPRVLPILLAAFRAACGQGRVDLAESYLRAARQAAEQPGTSNPVYRYAIETADFRLRRLKGVPTDQAQTVAALQKAWSTLQSYQPAQRWTEDKAWAEARHATRFWVEEMAAYPEAAAQVLPQMARTLLAWNNSPGVDALLAQLQGDQGLVYLDETLALYAMLTATVDQVSTVAEMSPSLFSGRELLRISSDLDGAVGALKRLPVQLGVASAAYPIGSSGLLLELQARSQYLRAMSGDTPAADKAEALLRALELARRTREPRFLLRYLLLCGQALAVVHREDEAVTLWKEAQVLAQNLSDSSREVEAATLLAAEFTRREDWKNAEIYAELAADRLRARAEKLEMNGYGSESPNSEVTSLLVGAALRADRPEQALAALTRGQQLSSAEAQMQGRTAVRSEALAVSRKEEVAAVLDDQAERLRAMPASPTRDALLSDTETLVADTRAEFLSGTRELRQKYSDIYSRVLRFDPLNLPQVQASLTSDVAVLQYFLTDDSLYLFLVTAQDLRLRRVALGRAALETTLLSYLRGLRRAIPGDTKLEAESASLYQVLIAPVEAEIGGSQTLVLIPSGRLSALPFASLLDSSGRPLAEKKRLLELAKTTDLTRLSGQGPKQAGSLLAFADATGDLPAAGREGERIVALFPNGKLLRGREATREAFVSLGSQADILHLATHGEWNLEDSLLNYLKMADQQQVSQNEIFSLVLDNTSLVVLSACNTAMGEGDGVGYVASLAEAFWIAGSQSVIASLWAVNDESTSLLMEEFYKALQAGDSRAESLRKAQMTVRAQERFTHPYYWAGFVLFGDWR